MHYALPDKKTTRSVEIPLLCCRPAIGGSDPVLHCVADRAERNPRTGRNVNIYSHPLPRGDHLLMAGAPMNETTRSDP